MAAAVLLATSEKIIDLPSGPSNDSTRSTPLELATTEVNGISPNSLQQKRQPKRSAVSAPNGPQPPRQQTTNTHRADTGWITQTPIECAKRHRSAQPIRFPLFEPCLSFTLNGSSSDDDAHTDRESQHGSLQHNSGCDSENGDVEVEPNGGVEIEPPLTLGIGRGALSVVCPPWWQLEPLDRPLHPSDTQHPPVEQPSNREDTHLHDHNTDCHKLKRKEVLSAGILKRKVTRTRFRFFGKRKPNVRLQPAAAMACLPNAPASHTQPGSSHDAAKNNHDNLSGTPVDPDSSS